MKLCRFQGQDHQSHSSTLRAFRSKRKAVHGGHEWTWSEKGEGVVVQWLSHVWLFTTPWTTAHQVPLSFSISQSLLRFMPIESVMLSNHLILCYPLLLLSIFPSIRVFSNESALHIKWPEYWSFGFSISLSNGYSGLISFRIDWFDLLIVQGTLKSLLQYHSSKASILQHSAFFMVQFAHPYMTTGKIIALTIQTFVCKVMSLLFNMLAKIHSPFGRWLKKQWWEALWT